MAILDDLCRAIREGHPNDTVMLVRQAVESGMDPVVIVEKAMVPTLRSVGEKYRDNELDIPGILLSAKCVQKGFATLKEFGGEYSQREWNRPFTDGDYCLMEILAECLELMLSHSNVLEEEDEISKIFETLLRDRTADYMEMSR